MKKLIHFMPCLMAALTLLIAPAYAGQPIEWGLGLQEAASPVKEQMVDFHTLLLYIISAIVAVVFVLLVLVVLLYNKRSNPEPAKFSHHVMLEVFWTAVPVLILIIIAIPSFQLLYYGDKVPAEPDMTIEVTGYQWYWKYKYPDYGNIEFDSYMIADEDIDESKGQVRLLSTDNPVVVPVGKNIQILTFGGDVLHSWAVPALGVKQDTVPGRMNETWFRVNKPGVYFGQCSELCGKDHAYMPIEIHAVSEEEFKAWVEKAKDEFSSNDNYMNTQPMKFAAIQE